MSPPHEYNEAILVTAHDSMGIGGSIRARGKVLDLAYNRRETWDKQSLGRDPDPRIHGLRPKKLYTSMEVTPAPVWALTQRPLVPSFTSVVG